MGVEPPPPPPDAPPCLDSLRRGAQKTQPPRPIATTRTPKFTKCADGLLRIGATRRAQRARCVPRAQGNRFWLPTAPSAPSAPAPGGKGGGFMLRSIGSSQQPPPPPFLATLDDPAPADPSYMPHIRCGGEHPAKLHGLVRLCVEQGCPSEQTKTERS